MPDTRKKKRKPFDKEFLSKFQESFNYSYRKLDTNRELRLEAVRQYTGSNYSANGATKKVPVNLVELAVKIYARFFSARRPRAMVSTTETMMKPYAKTFALAIDKLLKDINFGQTLEKLKIDALLSVGILKVGLNNSRTVEIDGFYHDVGQPFCDLISLDDFVFDVAAKDWEKSRYMGNRYRLSIDDMLDSGLFDEKVVKKLVAEPLKNHNDDGGEKVSSITVDSYENVEDFDDEVELWDFWFPKLNKIVTIAFNNSTQDNNKPILVLRTIDWDGPEGGPYRILSLADVPDNVMPLAPVSQWMDLHDLFNRLFRKLGDQAERQKTIGIVQRGNAEDASKIVESEDGELYAFDQPNGSKELRMGGVDQINFAFALEVKNLFSWLAGNLESMGGLSAQSETLGQDKLLAQSSSQRMADMQDRYIEFVDLIINDLGYYLWTDPIQEVSVNKTIPGIDIELPETFSANNHQGNYGDYGIEIEPYSMQHQTPQSRLQNIERIFSQIIAPFAPQMDAQGLSINFQNFMDIISRYADLPEMNEILEMNEEMFSSLSGQGQPGSPPTTNRINTRVNIPGANRAGSDSALGQVLAGGNPQKSERAAIGR